MSDNSHEATPETYDGRVGAAASSIESSDDIQSAAERIVESVPVELKAEARKLVMLATGFRGPTPPPAVLEEYERLVPGSAKRFLDDYFLQKTAEAEHRRGLQAKQLEYNREAQRKAHEARIKWMETVNESRTRGQRFALTVALVVAVAGVIALLKGQATAAAVIIGSGIASSIAAMLLGHFKGKQKNLQSTDGV